MSSPTQAHARAFLVALCLISFVVVTESLLVRDVFSQSTVEAHRDKPPKPSPDIPKDASVEADEYASILLRAMIDAPHSWELIIRGPLYWLALWTVIGVTIVFQNIDQSTNDWVLPCFNIHFLSVMMLRIQAAIQTRTASFAPAKVVPMIVSPASLGTSSKGHFRGHGRSASRVASIDF